MTRPAWGTAPIQCGKRGCGWRGYETDLATRKERLWSFYVCPACRCDSYVFMTPRQIAAWERAKSAASQAIEGASNA